MKVVSLFSGAGGLDLGFVKAGHRIVWANDNYEDAVRTYRMNLGNHIVLGDIHTIASADIPACDIVIGGFPCQGFSVANMKRCVGDARNELYKQMLRVIQDKRPAFFLAENVKGILSLEKGRVVQLIVRDFESAGYEVAYRLHNAADFGVPQKRMRVLFFGRRKDVAGTLAFPSASHGDPLLLGEDDARLPWVSVGQALSDIPEPLDVPGGLPNHTCSKYKLRFNGYLGHRMIDPDQPAPTITARGDAKGGVVVIHHPNNKRRMSARELAIVQSFPNDYVFYGCRSSVYRQIANAVPPLLAYAAARQFPAREEV